MWKLLFLTIYTCSLIASCPFCNPTIIEEQSILQAKYFNVIVDYEARSPGHLLITTKRHIPAAQALTAEEWSEFAQILPKIVFLFENRFGTDQYVLLEKNGPNAFQEIPHVHFHLLPITTQTWQDVFDVWPKRLTPSEVQKECRAYIDLLPVYP